MASLRCARIIAPKMSKVEWRIFTVLCNSKALTMFQTFRNWGMDKETLCKILIPVGSWQHQSHPWFGKKFTEMKEDKLQKTRSFPINVALHWRGDVPEARLDTTHHGLGNYLLQPSCQWDGKRTASAILLEQDPNKGFNFVSFPIPPLDCRVSSIVDWIHSFGSCFEKEKRICLCLLILWVLFFSVNLVKLPC